MTQLSSRPPYSDDPFPYMPDGGSSRHAHPGVLGSKRLVHAPRPEFDRPQHNRTNVVLADLRGYWKRHGKKLTARRAAEYLDIRDIDQLNAPAEDIDHARVVLTRLAAFARTA